MKANMEKYIDNIEMLQEEVKIHIASGKKIKTTKKGDFVGMYKEQKVRINGLIVKGLEHNILSVRKLVQITIR